MSETKVRMMDADAVEAALIEFRDSMCDTQPADVFEECTYNVIMDCIRTMNAIPTIDPDSLRPKGRWDKAHIAGYLKCSCCKDAFIYEEWLESGKWNYCPNCGVKMEG